ncbi:ATP-dependent RNA helicase DQX1 [Bagarius yarrelli]|uniref:ATP-dependent RNA helicase DQX1 n=1 Tax=Bagarius yarrelli TaxID=175774 RepID=A0A556TWU0_BAGYA|nr:ATP-dependent RNA helicase DQX1 [Bagarius yarrelli]
MGSTTLHALPQCPPLHLNPLFSLSFAPPTHHAPPPPLPHTPSPHHRAPPVPHTHSHLHTPTRGASLLTLSRVAMEMEKPSPPKKPLPADPLGRSSQQRRSTLTSHLSATGSALPIVQPNRRSSGFSDGESVGSDADFGFGDDLELNQFDGLPYSSRYYKLLKNRHRLPIWEWRQNFMSILETNQLVIISGTTKSGKSTQVPQWCAEFCLSAQYQHGVVVCSQIQRQQAVDLALHVADEMDVNIGHEVGYSIPLENCCSTDTVLRYCTDDVLLRELMSDPLLEHYGVVVIDQSHERTVSTDLLIALLKEVLLQRSELRVVLLSVTPASHTFLAHFSGAVHLQVKAPCSPEVLYSSRSGTENFSAALRLVLEVHRTKEPGDIAVFLASEQEVDCACSLLAKEASRLNSHLGELVPVAVCPGHAGICPPITQHQKRGRRVYNPRLRASSEVIKPISRCRAEIRKQLVGSAGKCFCLYPEKTVLCSEIPARISESNITSAVLFLKRMELAGIRHCDFINRPDPEGLMQALEELDYLAALDDDGNLSEIGIIMSELPLDPQMTKALLVSCEFDCASEVLTIAAMLAAPSCFLKPPVGMETEAMLCRMKLYHPEGDHFTLINIYNSYKNSQKVPYFTQEKWCQDYFLCCAALETAEAVRAELSDILKRLELPISEPAFGTKTNIHNVKRALLAGFFMQIARDVDGSGNYFMLSNKHMAQLHRLSTYGVQTHKFGLPEWVLFHEFTPCSSNCIRTVTQISPKVFLQMAPQYFFTNLPPSECKEILQHIMETEVAGSKNMKQKTHPRNSEDKMALNQNHSEEGGVIINSNESVLMFCKNVELMFTDTDGLPDLFRKNWKGSIYLTPYRVIFVTRGKGALRSFTMQFHLMKDCVVKQPVFGANYIKGIVTSQLGGGWEGSTTFKLIFISGGAIEFGQYMFQVAAQAFRVQPVTPNLWCTYMPNGAVAYPPPPPPFGIYLTGPPPPPPPPPPGYLYTAPSLPAYPTAPPPPYSASVTQTTLEPNQPHTPPGLDRSHRTTEIPRPD